MNIFGSKIKFLNFILNRVFEFIKISYLRKFDFDPPQYAKFL